MTLAEAIKNIREKKPWPSQAVVTERDILLLILEALLGEVVE